MKVPHKFKLMLVSSPFEPAEYARVCLVCCVEEPADGKYDPVCYRVQWFRGSVNRFINGIGNLLASL